MHAPTTSEGMHRLLIEAIGDATALAQLAPDGFLSPENWRYAVERVRQSHFAHLPVWEGSVALGALIARRFLDSEAGRLPYESLRIMSLDRALIALVMPMSERMRRGVQFDFRPRPEGGGFINIRGTLAVRAGTVLGFYRTVIEAIPGRHEVRLVSQAKDSMSLEVSVVVDPCPDQAKAWRGHAGAMG